MLLDLKFVAYQEDRMPSRQQKGRRTLEGKVTPEKQEQDSHMQQEGKKRTKERVQLDFSPEALSRLDHLKDQMGLNTRAEVFRNALRILEWFITETDPNDTIIVRDPQGEVVSTFKAKLLYGSTE
jgi:hypothetical protein